MGATSYDWTRFDLKMVVKAEIETVSSLLFSQQGLESWFLRTSIFYKAAAQSRDANETVETGDSYLWHWHGHDDSVFEKGLVLEANGLDLLAFSFGGPADSPIRVVIELLALDGETMVKLKQENMPTDEASKVRFHLGCTQGWVFYLANLKSVLEGGIDLRNKEMKYQQVINS